MDDLVGDWLAYLSGERKLRSATIRTRKRDMARIESFTGKKARQVTKDDLRAFIRKSDYAAATIENTVGAVKSFHVWGDLEGLWQRNGIMGVSTPRRTQRPGGSLSVAGVLTLMDSIRRSVEARLLLFGLYQGFRVGESAQITEVGDTITYVAKGGKPWEVPTHPVVARNARFLLRSGPTTTDTLHRVARSMRRRVGFHFVPHDLRRTFARTLREMPAPEEVISELLAHSRTTTRHYTNGVPLHQQKKFLVALRYKSLT